MARHRNIRNAKSFDYEYDDDDLYGHSYEDDYGVSPGTMAQYSYSRSRQQGNNFSSFMPSESTVQEADEDAFEDVPDFRGKPSNPALPTQPATGGDILLSSCIEMMHDVVGDSYSDEAMKRAAINADYDVERALNFLLSSPKEPPEAAFQLPKYGESSFPTAQAPLEQRTKRNRRNDRKKNTSEQSEGVASNVIKPTKVLTSVGPRKTGFSAVDDQLYDIKNPTQNTKRHSYPDIDILSIGSSSTKVISSAAPSKTGFNTGNDSAKVLNGDMRGKKKSKLNNVAGIETGVKTMRLENGEAKTAKLPKPDVFSETLAVEKSENVSLTPNPKQKSETNGEEHRNSKSTKELMAKYEQRQNDSKQMISMVVIGHVDAGKSTLMGHVLFQCGEVSKRLMHKYEQESRKLGKASFAYAWVLDETGEERSRGVTMDVGLTSFETKNRLVTLMDAPGHRDFIPNMISGASQADVAVLVVNATTGEFEAGFDLGGQTREHSLLIRSLGISQLAVAVNKLDTVEWSQKRFDEIVSKLSAFLRQAGFKESDVTYVPVSGLMGENLTKPATDKKLTAWYKGPCLVDVIDQFKAPLRPVDYPLRFCVTDVTRGQGTGISVSGKVETGGVKVGNKVVVLPAGEQSLVKGIEFHDGVKTDVLLAGDHGTLTCHGIDIMKIQTGNVLSDIKNPIPVVSNFRARIIIFNISVPVTRGFPVELHYKAASEPAVIKRLLSILHKSTGEVVSKKPKVILKGQNVLVQIMVHRPICIEEYSKVKEMGRFTLRYGGATIAAGVVTEVLK